MQTQGASSRVLVVDDEVVRAARTRSLLEHAGYQAVVTVSATDISGYLDDGVPTVVLLDISSPGAAREMTTRHSAISAAVADRCPIVLYGDMTESRGTEPPPSSGLPPAKVRDGLLDLLMGLLPDPTPPPPAMQSDWPQESERPTNPINLGTPKSAAKSEDPSALAGPESGEAAKVGTRQGEWERVRLLLIDESEMTLELMQERLVAEGADVRIAVALGEVDSIVANWCPNLVVANVKRADLAGDALCARLKHAVGSSELRILLCSTLPDAELRLLAMAAGADGFVSKSRGLDSFVREVVEMTMKLSPPNMAMGRARHA